MHSGFPSDFPDNLPKNWMEQREAYAKEIRKVIRECDGSMMLAARCLGITISQLDVVLRTSTIRQRDLKELVLYQVPTEYLRMTLEQVEQDIERRRVLYRSEALDALHSLAMMPLSENSAQNQVKLLAASRLYSETNDPQIGSEIDQTLRALNADYQRSAPRIKQIRETVREVTYEEAIPAIDVTPE